MILRRTDSWTAEAGGRRGFKGSVQKLLLSWILICLLVFTACGQGELTYENVDEHIESVGATVKEDAAEPTPSPVSGEWAVLGLIAGGQGNQELYDRYYENLQAQLKGNKGVLSETSYTDYAKAAICVRAIGKSPQDVVGYDLLKPLDDRKKVSEQGINGPIYALIASSVCGTPLENEEAYIKEIIDWMNSEEREDSVDLVAMALQALSFYEGREDVDKAIETGLTYLSEEQGDDGGYGTAEGTSQVIIALTCLGLDPLEDEKFVKGENNLGNGLMTFRKGDGFLHKVDDEEINPMATEQGLLALCSIQLFQVDRALFERVVV